MLKDQFYISTLIAGYLQGELSDEQNRELNAWIAASPANSNYLQKEFGTEKRVRVLLNQYHSLDEDAIWHKTIHKLQNSKHQGNEVKVKRIYPFYYKIAAVAALLVMGTLVLILFKLNRTGKNADFVINHSQDIPAGRNGATLRLANGRMINLSDAAEGKLAEESGVRITKSGNGQVVYTNASGTQSGTIANDAARGKQFNTLSTSNGQQYQLILPDQTKVWLNAASSIKYPASFAGVKARRVEITGEVYFEVAKMTASSPAAALPPRGGTISSLRGGTPKQSKQRIPFLVTTKDQTVEVLGTHFNINAYPDEPVTKTTLLEGKVAVSFSPKEARYAGKGVILQPGEQSALFPAGTIEVKPVNTENVVAWKNGDLVLRDIDFKVLMRKIARWYDVEIIYGPSAPSSLKLVGVVSRSKNISAVLKVLQATGEVHFTIEGRRVTVTK